MEQKSTFCIINYYFFPNQCRLRLFFFRQASSTKKLIINKAITEIQVKVSWLRIVWINNKANKARFNTTEQIRIQRLAPVCPEMRKWPKLTMAYTNKKARLAISPTADNGKISQTFLKPNHIKNCSKLLLRVFFIAQKRHGF